MKVSGGYWWIWAWMKRCLRPKGKRKVRSTRQKWVVREAMSHKYEVPHRKAIGRWKNERGKGGPFPVLLDWTFLERASFSYYYSHFLFWYQNLSLSSPLFPGLGVTIIVHQLLPQVAPLSCLQHFLFTALPYGKNQVKLGEREIKRVRERYRRWLVTWMLNN